MKKAFFLTVVVALMTTGLTVRLLSLSSFNSDSHHQQQQNQTVGETRAELSVGGSCGMCKTRIETVAKSVDGVTIAEWDAETKKLQLNFDASKTSVDAIGKAIAAAGHDNDLHKADDKVYDALPECCKYR